MINADNPIDKKLDAIAQIIDFAFDNKSIDGTNHAFVLIKELEALELTAKQEAILLYYKSNTWANRLNENKRQITWEWDIPEIQGQIIALRKCLNSNGFEDLEVVLQCQILTNLGNALNSVGRCIEAVEMWDKAIEIDETFAMANGNRGLGLNYYGHSLYDQGHSAVLMFAASESYIKAASKSAYFDNVANTHLRDVFKENAKKIAAQIDIEETRKLLDGYEDDLGDTEDEKNYRRWALKNRLFINPLNDLGDLSLASCDVMTLPAIFTKTAEGKDSGQPPLVISFYNQLKQEYASARYLLFQALQSTEPHFSDRDVLLYNTLDYPSYGLSAEYMRTAFRVAYSLFDKTAYFLNHYLSLGHSHRSVNFRNVWSKPNIKGAFKLHPILQDRENWSLRGLFWLSKDIYEKDFKDVTEPDARALHDIRNHLEHKYLQILDSTFVSTTAHENISGEPDYKITSDDFSVKTLRVFKLARACLIYLSMAIHREEKNRNVDSQGMGLVTPMFLDTWEDEWKT